MKNLATPLLLLVVLALLPLDAHAKDVGYLTLTIPAQDDFSTTVAKPPAWARVFSFCFDSDFEGAEIGFWVSQTSDDPNDMVLLHREDPANDVIVDEFWLAADAGVCVSMGEELSALLAPFRFWRIQSDEDQLMDTPTTITVAYKE